MNRIILNIIGVIFIVVLCAMVYFGYNFAELKKKEVENTARFQCANSTRYEVKDGEATVSYPVEDLYEKCLDEKGIN